MEGRQSLLWVAPRAHDTSTISNKDWNSVRSRFWCKCVAMSVREPPGEVEQSRFDPVQLCFLNITRLEACQGCGAVDWAFRIFIVNLAFVIYLTFILVSAACSIDSSVKIETGSDSCVLTSYYTSGEGKGHQKVLVPLLQ